MKKIFCGGLLSLLYLSCGDDKPEPASLSLNSTEIKFENSGGSVRITLTANGKWQANDIPGWISLDHTGGDASTEITVTAEANPTIDHREAEISFVREDQTVALTIFQAKTIMKPTWTSLTFSFFDEVGFVSQPDDSERKYHFLTRQLFVNPDAGSRIAEKIFLGNLVDRELETNTDISEYTGYTFLPITVSSSTGTEESHTFIPSKSEQDAYAARVLAGKPGLERFVADPSGVLYDSHRCLHLIGVGNMGVSLDEVVSGKSYREQEMTRSKGIIYSFCHTLFTLSMDLQEHIVEETIDRSDFPGNRLSYISSVSYGRIGLLIVESDHTESRLKSAVRKVMQNQSAELTEEDREVLDELNAFHLYFDESQKLVVLKGKTDAIESYKNQVSDLTRYHVFPFKFTVSDYFEPGEASMTFRMILP